ncbi:MAG: ADP-ribosylglycohydrolase family protein [Chitinispirillaceae bacterium]
MIGAIAGDIIGSVYEFDPVKVKDFPLFDPRCRFTDDTVLTVAIADAILSGESYVDSVRRIGLKYPDVGYGESFKRWLHSPGAGPYNSWGNGSAMRVSPVGFAFATEEEVLAQARATAAITHDHPEGVKGAQATALAVFLARTANSKETIRSRIAGRFGYDLDRTVEEIRPGYSFDVSCQGSVPQAIVSFLDSITYEDAVRNAVSLGGDSDTIACIAGGIAEAFYGGVPRTIREKVKKSLAPELWAVTERFCQKHGKENF